jgi:pilus assembly protein CpaF
MTTTTTTSLANLASSVGLGPLARALADPTVTEVMVNDASQLWIERGGSLHVLGELDAAELETFVERALVPLGRRLDRLSPIVDARLPDGSRLCAISAPVAVDGMSLAIRRFGAPRRPLSSFATPRVVDLLREVVAARCNVLVSGATSSGKTTLLGSLLADAATTDRIITLEDTAELQLGSDHVVRLEARAATADGVGAVDLTTLLRAALRMRPDRLVIGEVRGDEALPLVQALNTGHDGSLATCHANSALDALARLESLVVQAAPAWPLDAVRDQVRRSIDVVVHVERAEGGARRVTEVAEVRLQPGVAHALEVRTLVDGARALAPITRRRAA